jgi:hypothetical protein
MNEPSHHRTLSKRIIWCGRFQGLLPEPGKLLVKVPTPLIVEVYRKGTHWLVRGRKTGNDFPGIYGSAQEAMSAIAGKFEKQLGDWEPYDLNGKLVTEDEPELSKKAVSTPRDRYGL